MELNVVDNSISRSMHQRHLPIGVFDSGMGGLTVLKALIKQLPQESFIYLGDTARLPYGTKSSTTVINYAMQMARILVEQQIKLMVVACNTATTSALPYLINHLPGLPIMGVVEPGAQTVVARTQNQRIAILATETTINSGVYQATIRKLNPEITVITQSCGLFVALTEEGCVDDEIADAAVAKYLAPLLQHPILPDTVLLGCTHFPVLSKPLRKVLGPHMHIVDSATATADGVQQALTKLDLLSDHPRSPLSFLVTDLPERFARVGEIFLGEAIPLSMVSLIDSLRS